MQSPKLPTLHPYSSWHRPDQEKKKYKEEEEGEIFIIEAEQKMKCSC